MLRYLLFLTTFLLLLAPVNAQKAIYKIEFISNWSSTTHPTDYPSSNAHWSSLVGASHNSSVSFFEIGQLATDGVELVAESGNNSIITNEINTSITNGNTYKIIEGSGLSTGPGTITINAVEFDMSFPLVSLITMIAPSPDWVAEVNNIKLTDNNNNWITSISLDVYATDAGTDNGVTYGSSNDDTNPPSNISSLKDTAPFSDQIIGTFTFNLQEVLAIENQELKNSISIYPNPSNGEIFINSSNLHTLEKVELYTVNGKKVKEYFDLSDKKSLDFSSLQKGLYFLKVASNNKSVVKKVVLR